MLKKSLHQAVIGDPPSWMNDKDVKVCYACFEVFTLTCRKHHCRRCRNIFCGKCTTKRNKILMYGIDEVVRICDKCRDDLVPENEYFINHRRLLFDGGLFKISSSWRLFNKSVRLRMINDNILAFDDDVRNETIQINMKEVVRVNNIAFKGFEIVLPSKTYQFEAESLNVMNAWKIALEFAKVRAEKPIFRESVVFDRELWIRKLREEEEKDAKSTSVPNNFSFFAWLPRKTKAKKETEHNECIVCLDKEPSQVILPCGHLCLCSGCSVIQNWSNCPICRRNVNGIIPVYR